MEDDYFDRLLGILGGFPRGRSRASKGLLRQALEDLKKSDEEPSP